MLQYYRNSTLSQFRLRKTSFLLLPPHDSAVFGIDPNDPNTYNQSQSRRGERSTRLRTWIFRSQSKIGWFLTWIEKKRFSTSDYIGFGLVTRNSPSSLDSNSPIQLNISTTATLGTGESGCCRKRFEQESMYVLSTKNVAVVERWPLVKVRGLSWPLISSQSTPTVQGACLHIYGSL